MPGYFTFASWRQEGKTQLDCRNWLPMERIAEFQLFCWWPTRTSTQNVIVSCMPSLVPKSLRRIRFSRGSQLRSGDNKYREAATQFIETCASILVGTAAGPNSIGSDTFFNRRNTVPTANRCTAPLVAARQTNASLIAKSPRLSPARP